MFTGPQSWVSQGKKSAVSSDSVAATAFIARTSGLDATHTAAYKALLNGLTTDGLFNSDGTSSIFDALYIIATQDEATAVLNLVSTSFGITKNGTPNFTADTGYLGTDSASPSNFLDTGFNPSTASSPKYTQNSAHLSAWSLTNATPTNGGAIIGLNAADTVIQSNIFPRFSDGNLYGRIDDVSASSGSAVADSLGHFAVVRTDSTHSQTYKEGSLVANPNAVSAVIQNGNIYVLAINRIGTGAINGGGYRIAASSIGAALTATQVSNFRDRVRTYLTSVGVP